MPATVFAAMRHQRAMASLLMAFQRAALDTEPVPASMPLGVGKSRVETKRAMTETQQVNLRVSPEHAQLVRLFVQRLREGGPSYEREVRLFLLEPYTPHYMTISELDRRFGEILRRMESLEAEVRGSSTRESPELNNRSL